MILASQSPRRRQLLEELGYSLEVLPADIDETRRPGESPEELVRRLAEQKAEASLELARGEGVRDSDDLLVAADTIVWDDEGDVLGKPADAADAARMLTALSGREHTVYTGVAVLRGGEMIGYGIGAIRELVLRTHADIGLAHDGDADLVRFVDREGK